MFQYRSADNTVIAATHGRGLFSGEFSTGVVNPNSFTATAQSKSQIDLSWEQNLSAEDVMIAFNTTNTFGTQVNGTAYSSGNSIPSGGKVIYNGSLKTYSHTSLSSATTYYYKAWSVNVSDNYSPGIITNETTDCGTISLPYSQNIIELNKNPGIYIIKIISPKDNFSKKIFIH